MTDTKNSEKAKSFTTRVSGETWAKINKYKEYGKWNTNQFTNHALDTFFEIIEADELDPKLPLVCETIRDIRRKSQSYLISDKSLNAKKAEKEEQPAQPKSQGQQMRERMASVDKPWLKSSVDT